MADKEGMRISARTLPEVFPPSIPKALCVPCALGCSTCQSDKEVLSPGFSLLDHELQKVSDTCSFILRVLWV